MSSHIDFLKNANQSYLDNPLQPSKQSELEIREKLATGQSPHTMVLSCADSRVPVEKILNGHTGDYFVVRSAGNVAETSQIASLEYAAAVLGSKALLVLGHSSCGAVSAAVEVVTEKKELPSLHLNKLAQMISPAVEKTLSKGDINKHECIGQSIEENVRWQISTLRESSEILRNLERDGKLEFIGGVYNLESGKIDFLDSPTS